MLASNVLRGLFGLCHFLASFRSLKRFPFADWTLFTR